ncbi:MAG TPA: SAM-dependent methyltransferase, partial [Pyrinomonadaceae bacterium]|nr:SAM-dependent methyltransferase [Pyrinomonadaceae bacterium]
MTPREEEHDSTRTDDSLASRLRARILDEGPVTFRDWMESALYDPRAGYYRRGRAGVWGRAGDYRTSPERTPLFAATFARHFAALHEELGGPREFHVVESGAGAGDFAAVALATLRRDHPRVYAALRYLVDEKGTEGTETGAALVNETLAAKLAPFEGRVAPFSLARSRAPL